MKEQIQEVEDKVIDEEPEDGKTLDLDGLADYLANGISSCLVVTIIIASLTAILIISFSGIIHRLSEMERKIDYCYQAHKKAENKMHLNKKPRLLKRTRRMNNETTGATVKEMINDTKQPNTLIDEKKVDTIQLVEELNRLKAELITLKAKEREWTEIKRSAVEIIQYDETMAKQSSYWRSMFLTLIQGLAIDKEIIEQHISFDIKHAGAEVSNVSMKPKTDKGMKLIQIWGVMDMLTDLIKGLGLQSKQKIEG